MSSDALRKNTGKVEFMQLPFDCLAEVAKVFMQAKEKYPDQENGKANWEKLWGDNTVKMCLNSLIRHAAQLQAGEMRDDESRQLHAAHIVCNALFIIRYNLENKQ